MRVLRQHEDNAKRFSRRAALILGGQAAVIGALGWRLYDLQVVRSADLRQIAQENRISIRLVPPVRSDILDRHGESLAIVRGSYTVYLERRRSPDPEESLRHLAALGPLPEDRRKEILAFLLENPGAGIIPIMEDANWTIVARVAANAPSLPGVSTERSTIRQYPQGPAFAHAVGYVGPISASDIRENPGLVPLRALRDLRVGKRGVERGMDQQLRGRPGVAHLEVNAHGHVVRELRREPASSGRDVVLTLDRVLQQYAYTRFGDESGAAVVMDIVNGDLLCLVSKPSFDPNLFANRISKAAWSELNHNPRRPLVDRATTGEYPPGSTFKMIVALAALEGDHRIPANRTYCNGQVELGDRVFRCWNRGGHGWLAMRDAIKQSCDAYFYLAAGDLEIDQIAEMAERFGLGQDFDIGVPYVRRGLIPTRSWKLADRGAPWMQGDSFNAGIGQGFVLSTPLQLAVMTARIANGEYRVQPRLVLSPHGGSTPRFAPLGVDRAHIDLMHDAMFAVCNETKGTAYASRIIDADTRIAGKTGTSQVRGRGAGRNEARVEETPRHLRNHALFVGFGPVHAPRYAVSVVVEHGVSGAVAAAPIGRDLLWHAAHGRPANPGALPPPEERRDA